MSNTQETASKCIVGKNYCKAFRASRGLPASVVPDLVDGEGKVTKDGIKETKLFAVNLHSNPDRTVSKWHVGINCMQEELNRQVDKHDMPCQKGHMRSIMSIKKMQDEIVKEKSSTAKSKEGTVKYDDIQSHLEANMSEEQKVMAVDCCLCCGHARTHTHNI